MITGYKGNTKYKRLNRYRTEKRGDGGGGSMEGNMSVDNKLLNYEQTLGGQVPENICRLKIEQFPHLFGLSLLFFYESSTPELINM